MVILLSGCAATGRTAEPVAQDAGRVPAHDQRRAVTALLRSIDEAWNAGDAAAFASHWTRDGVVVSPQGRRTEGRRSIRTEQEAAFSGPMKGTTHKLDAAHAEWPARDVAVVDGDATISGLKGSDGTTYPPLSAKFTCVCVYQGGRWLVSHMVSYTFMSS
ncbi:SgcJ/EcaC family oxidoreductase [Actinomadura fibrosa]|uniref:SgcJ/EcaC family oxidoreductase n=1 Tax=Actinomadura fibrosa TaxID=111802 RepID=A0ABW2XEQ6_9ACTN|nr:SgcJ/EcaC family oxidoreductase [Actinomadura fibrosa]